jgi:hypothetical protein
VTKRFIEERLSPASRVWRVVDTADALPPWGFGQYPAEDLNRTEAQEAAELLNRGCRAEQEG